MGCGPLDVLMRSPRRTTPLVVAALAVVAAVAASGAPSHGASVHAAATEIAMYPIGGTTTANPHTKISFRGSTHPRDLTVTGSETGRHRGHLELHSDGKGASFDPD